MSCSSTIHLTSLVQSPGFTQSPTGLCWSRWPGRRFWQKVITMHTRVHPALEKHLALMWGVTWQASFLPRLREERRQCRE